MRKARRILVVSPIRSHPADQGNSARIQVLASELMAGGIEVEFFYYGMEGLTDQQRCEMEAFWADFHFMPSLPLKEASFARHWGIDDWCPEELRLAVRKLHLLRGYDAVLVNYVWMSRVLVDLPGTFKIIDTHDMFGDRHKISIREGMEPRWYFTSLAQEEQGYQRADLLLGIQDEETAFIRSRVRTPAMTVGHMMPPLFLTASEARTPRVTFGFLGSANPWNIRSVERLDLALGRGSGVDWLLAGSMLRQKLSLVSGPYMLGMVDRLEDFYSIIDCVINPMLGGTGLKIKTVEALSFGKPVIGTVDAFVGLPVKHEAHRLKTVDECAKFMSHYQRDVAFRDELRIASRVLYFDYTLKVVKEIEALVKAVVKDSLSHASFGSS
jgi:hypothetical protein